MNWYYVENGQQAGPVDDVQLDALQSAGRINSETLVWREGMANWEPHSKARPSAAPPIPMFAPVAGSTGFPSTTGGATAVCNECGRSFPAEDMMRYGASNICAACKPVFIQRIKEGASLPGTFEYAGFWVRFVAKFVDGIILGAFGAAIGAATAAVNPSVGRESIVEAVFSVRSLLGFVLGIAYTTFFLGKYGATPGKMALKLRVIRSDGSEISYLRALGRHFAEIVSQLTLYIGYIMAAFDDEKRALHDRIADTRVVKK